MKHASFFVIATLISFTSISADIDSSGYYLQQAIQHKQAGKSREASVYFQKAIAFKPGDIQLILQYANALLEDRKFMPAIAQFNLVLKHDANNAEAYEKLCNISYLYNRWTEVIEYGTKLNANPEKAPVKYMLAKAYYYEEEYELCQQVLNKLIVQNPAHLEGIILLGKVYIELGAYKKAEGLYAQALVQKPYDADLLYEYGLLQFVLNRPREAVKYFEIAHEKGYKADLDYKENLGMAYLSFDIEKGVLVLAQVLERKPDNPEINLQIANAYYKSKNFDQAADKYYRMYMLDPANTRALYMMGMAFQKKGDKKKGMDLCEQALQLDPSLAEYKVLGYAK